MILAATLVAGCGSLGLFEPRPDAPEPDVARSFYTPATAADGSLLIIGDWGSGSSEESVVAAGMETFAASNPVQAILTTGDNIYSDDLDEALAPYDWAIANDIDFWITWGNHDVESQQRIDDVNDVFASPPPWATVDWGEVTVIILDSNEVGSSAQLEYLEEEMSRIDKPTVVVFHHPPYSCSAHEGYDAVVDEFLPRFDDDVVLVLNGHAHAYQRFEEDGVEYVVTGGGGKGLHGVDGCPSDYPLRASASDSYHFVALSQEPGALVLKAIDADGTQIDETVITLPSSAGDDEAPNA